MGIQGLLQFAKNASRESHLSEFSGSCVAVDAYCWLHKGCFSCADQLVKGEKTNRYINYCMKLVNVLVQHNIKPILVFDGLHLPSKQETEIKREENRRKYKKLARQYLREGKLKEARDCFARCVNVTSLMALEVIQACRKLGVDCIVAPYEADAQLAYLNRKGIAQTIITEDSDLMLFGCDRVFYKMDITGRGILLEKENLHRCSSLTGKNFTFEKFRRMCILSGCDYLASLPGIGLVKASRFFSVINSDDIRASLKKLPSYLKMSNMIVSDDYIDGFIRAENTFLYQLVFCPRERKLVPNSPYPQDLDWKSFDYAGSYLPNDQALQIALGNIDVNTMHVIDDFNPDLPQKSHSWTQIKSSSIWNKTYNPSSIKETTLNLKSTKDKVITLSLDMFKKCRSPKKKASPKKRVQKEMDNEITPNDLEDIYGSSRKKIKSSTSVKQEPNSIEGRTTQNPFKVEGKTPSPKKKVISRFFKPLSPRENKIIEFKTCIADGEKTEVEDKLLSEEDLKSKIDLDSSNLNTSSKEDFDVCKKKHSPKVSTTNFQSLGAIASSSQNSPYSSQENYEPLEDMSMTVCSIDSMSMSQDLNVSGEQCIPTSEVVIVEHLSTTPQETSSKFHAKRKQPIRKPGLSKPKRKDTSSKAKIQLSIMDSLQRFSYKKSKLLGQS